MKLTYSARTMEVADPTAELAQLKDLIERSRAHALAQVDPEVRVHMLEAVRDAEYDLAARAVAPSSGRASQLDEAWNAMGYRDGSRD